MTPGMTDVVVSFQHDVIDAVLRQPVADRKACMAAPDDHDLVVFHHRAGRGGASVKPCDPSAA